jgi:hypothetical protein
MNRFLLLAIVVSIITGCHNNRSDSNDSVATKDTLQSSNQSTPSASIVPERDRLITALQQLQRDMASRNKETIAAYFRFPVDNEVLQLLDVNATFDKQLAANNHMLSRQLFLSSFNDIYENLEMQGFDDVFKNVPLSELKDTAQKQVEARVPDGVCAHFYNITIEGKEVTVQYGVYTSEEQNTTNSTEALECPEYAAFWTFTFDGQKLVFNRHQVAG